MLFAVVIVKDSLIFIGSEGRKFFFVKVSPFLGGSQNVQARLPTRNNRYLDKQNIG